MKMSMALWMATFLWLIVVPVASQTGPIAQRIEERLAARKRITAVTSLPLKVNCGGEAYEDYEADVNHFFGGDALIDSRTVSGGTDPPIANTEDDELYYSGRSDIEGDGFYYVFTGLQDGIYSLKLLFSESQFTQAGDRLFDIIITESFIVNESEEQVYADFDIFARAGATDTAYTLSTNVTTVDDEIIIYFEPFVRDAFINAFELDLVEEVGMGFINCGGERVWPAERDGSFVGGNPNRSPERFAINFTAIGDSTDALLSEEMFYTDREDQLTFSYELYAPKDGDYLLELFFTEDFFGPGERLMDVTINGLLLLRNYDIYVQAGGRNRAIMESFVVPGIRNGLITVEFDSKARGEARVNAIRWMNIS